MIWFSESPELVIQVNNPPAHHTTPYPFCPITSLSPVDTDRQLFSFTRLTVAVASEKNHDGLSSRRSVSSGRTKVILISLIRNLGWVARQRPRPTLPPPRLHLLGAPTGDHGTYTVLKLSLSQTDPRSAMVAPVRCTNWRPCHLKLKLSLSQEVGCTAEAVTQSGTSVLMGWVARDWRTFCHLSSKSAGALSCNPAQYSENFASTNSLFCELR